MGEMGQWEGSVRLDLQPYPDNGDNVGRQWYKNWCLKLWNVLQGVLDLVQYDYNDKADSDENDENDEK